MGMTSVYDNALIIAKAKEWADEFEEREAEIKRKESLIATWSAKAKEKLNEAQSILDDAKDVEGDSDKLQKTLEYMEKIRFKDGTTAKSRFEAKYGTKSKVTRAYIQSSVNDLLNRIDQKQSDDDSYDYY
jgi:hypothetical protein